jgi:hypothetical protein
LKDLQNLLWVLKKMLLVLGDLVNSRWNIDKITAIIDKCLLAGNQGQVRLLGFELLLYFIEALQNSMEEQHLTIFASAINLSLFIPQDANVILKNKPKDGNQNED